MFECRITILVTGFSVSCPTALNSQGALTIRTRSLTAAKLVALLLCALLSLSPLVTVASAAAVGDIDKSITDKKTASSSTSAQIDDLQTRLDASTAEYQNAYSQLAKVEQDVNKNQRLLNSALEQQSFYQSVLNKRSVIAYRNRNIPVIDVVLGSKSFADFITRLRFMGEISERDARVLTAAKHLKSDIEQRRDRLASQKQRRRDALALVANKQQQIQQLMTTQQALLTNIEGDIKKLEEEKTRKINEAKQAALAAAASGARSPGAPGSMAMLFPMPAPYAHGYTNDWGFARSGMSTGHQGTDIFASKGTPLIAVVDGTIGTMFGNSGRGGYRLWVEGDNGFNYYYAHLNNDAPGTNDGSGGPATAYAPGIVPGVHVTAGQVIAYSGNSGEAETTPPHLHFGITNGGENYINPYPYLKAADWK